MNENIKVFGIILLSILSIVIVGFLLILLPLLFQREQDYEDFLIPDISQSFEKELDLNKVCVCCISLKFTGTLDDSAKIEIYSKKAPQNIAFFSPIILKKGEYKSYNWRPDYYANYDLIFKYTPYNVKKGNLKIEWKGI